MSLSKHIANYDENQLSFSWFSKVTETFLLYGAQLAQGVAPPTILRSGHQVEIRDVRGVEGFLAIDANGFEIIRHPTSCYTIRKNLQMNLSSGLFAYLSVNSASPHQKFIN